MENSEKTKSGLCTAGLVLGIIGLCTSFIPIINNASFFMGVIAIIFGLLSIKKASKSKLFATIIIGILAIVITLSVQKSASDSLDALSDDLDKATGNSTEEVLKNDVDVEIGDFEVTTDEYGLNDTKLTVKLTNKTNETKSFDVQIEAVDLNGNRITQEYVYAMNLAAGQSQNFDIFTFISSDEVESMQNATFKVIEASSY